jgi:hypothetical protein
MANRSVETGGGLSLLDRDLSLSAGANAAEAVGAPPISQDRHGLRAGASRSGMQEFN